MSLTCDFEDLKPIFEEIINVGCCHRCAIRFLGLKAYSYEIPDIYLMNFGLLPRFGEEGQWPAKRKKPNPCVVCLGLLEDEFIDKIGSFQRLQEINEYKHETFTIHVTYPACISIRNHAMQLYLKDKFPDIFNVNENIKVSVMFRRSLDRRVCRIVDKELDVNSGLSLHFTIEYLLDRDECDFINAYIPEGKQDFSRHSVVAVLVTMEDAKFKELVRIPPKASIEEIYLASVKYSSNPIHITGRYCKYSRMLFQIPLSENNDVVIKHSVQDIILKAFTSVLGARELSFSASMFDEKSLRIVGEGRLFHVQINNPKIETITPSEFAKIQSEVAKSQIVTVKDLKVANKKYINLLMNRDRGLARIYKVLCVVFGNKDIDDCVNNINSHSRIKVQQKTPLKCLHKRDCVRNVLRSVYNIKAKKVEGKSNMLELDLCLEAGLQVDEFIHGDFGRTGPSISEMLKTPVDAVAIDLLGMTTVQESEYY